MLKTVSLSTSNWPWHRTLLYPQLTLSNLHKISHEFYKSPALNRSIVHFISASYSFQHLLQIRSKSYMAMIVWFNEVAAVWSTPYLVKYNFELVGVKCHDTESPVSLKCHTYTKNLALNSSSFHFPVWLIVSLMAILWHHILGTESDIVVFYAVYIYPDWILMLAKYQTLKRWNLIRILVS